MSEAVRFLVDCIFCASNGKRITNKESSIQHCGKYSCNDCLARNESSEFY
jgi:hypothetical protein